MSATFTERGQGSQIPPCDRGGHAWTFLVGAAMIEGLMWGKDRSNFNSGFPLTFGIFQTFYFTHPPFESNKYLPVVGTLATGISYLATPLITPFTIRYPMYRKYMIWFGWLTCIIALIGSSFATKLSHLIITQGLLYGLGFVVIYYPLLSMLNEWFVKRRGLAYGILFGAAGLCGLGLPFAIDKLLHTYGYVMTLRIYAVAIFVLVGPALPLLQNRLSPDISCFEETNPDTAIFAKVPFLSMTLSNVFQGLVFFLPGIYLPSYATSFASPRTNAPLLLSFLTLSQTLSQVVIGQLSDNYNPYLLLFLSTFLSSLCILVLWGFSNCLALLYVFAVLYGISAGGYSVLYSRFATHLTDNRATGLWLYSIFEFQRGIGNVIGGLAGGFLVVDEAGLVDGMYGLGKYMGVIAFAGIGMLTSSLGAMGHFWKGKQHNVM
ncbi:MFS general substrate transporter [Hyaloscypha bicolor E]|uniref:MFS general substrate transporter n=1 Tax=Hyaloscypha bicolor E TaxID=1095630 RepID=A0A2J6TB31_9HELO|nr:MFS general substrate transporter [Hyaloscypha bicolor E]PMD60225.1 MFS general substrate transporter [Hyaloscypha bicolor E]